jgi:Fic family protein
MTGIKQQKQRDDLKGLLAQFADGVAFEQIAEAARSSNLSRNTLFRRLNELLQAGDLIKTGRSRTTRYHLAVPPEQPASQADEIVKVPLTKVAANVQAQVRRPQGARKPVAYQHAFLDQYRPNVSAYLTAAERTKLAGLGRTATPDEPAGTHAQQILNRLLIDLSWNSSRLEGNTYSLLDTERLIDIGEQADGKSAADAQMILNHKDAIEFLVQSAGEINFNRQTILNLHAKLADNLLDNPNAAGRLRRIAVGISGSVYHPLAVPQQIDEYFDQVLATARAIRDPFEQAFFIMVQLPYLQPFEDVNKRVSRLAANIPLIRQNLSPISFVHVPKALYTDAMLAVYELNKVDLLKEVFVWAYERSANRYAAIRQTLGDPDPFRLTHRQALKLAVSEVIKAKLDKKAAAKFVAQWAENDIKTAERNRFIEIAETELLALHEGNFARYPVRPSEFAAWQAIWTARPALTPKRNKL